jgi:chromosome segregation ATPase
MCRDQAQQLVRPTGLTSRITDVPDSDDIETRLAIVEREVARLREQVALSSSDAAAARVLAAGADRDVSEVRAELRAHTQGLNALRETQLEQGREITTLRQDLVELGREMRGQGREMREGFATLATGMAQITALLTNITGSERDGS